MVRQIPIDLSQVIGNEWVGFPGGELEGRRPRALCPSCRAEAESLRSRSRQGEAGRASGSHEAPGGATPSERAGGGAPREVGKVDDRSRRLLCFQCYRLDLDRQRPLKAAGALNTATDERFQSTLPFEPINVARLVRLKAERAATQAARQTGTVQYADRVRHAQIAARHALQRNVARVEAGRARRDEDARDLYQHRTAVLAAAAHAAELQLPDAWLPFVVAR